MFVTALFCATGSSPPLVLDGQDLSLVSIQLNGNALKVYTSFMGATHFLNIITDGISFPYCEFIWK